MPETPIDTLRGLRDRADRLLDSIVSDLKPFQHDDRLTFRRKPDSLSHKRDVNVTTNCSYLKALIKKNNLNMLYKQKKKNITKKNHPIKMMKFIVKAQLMISRMTMNKALGGKSPRVSTKS